MGIYLFKTVEDFEKFYNAESRSVIKLIREIEDRPFLKSQKEAQVLIAELNLVMDQYRKKEYEYKNSIDGLLLALLMEIAKINHTDYERKN